MQNRKHKSRTKTRQNHKNSNPTTNEPKNNPRRPRQNQNGDEHMNPMKKMFGEMILKDCNNKITEFNNVCNYIQQYSQATVFLIPTKYIETITNELDPLPHIIYELRDSNDPEVKTLTLFNFGVMQRENILEELKKDD